MITFVSNLSGVFMWGNIYRFFFFYLNSTFIEFIVKSIFLIKIFFKLWVCHSAIQPITCYKMLFYHNCVTKISPADCSSYFPASPFGPSHFSGVFKRWRPRNLQTSYVEFLSSFRLTTLHCQSVVCRKRCQHIQLMCCQGLYTAMLYSGCNFTQGNQS